MSTSAQIIWRRHRRQERRAAAAQRRTIWTTLFTIAALVLFVAPVSFVLVNTAVFYLQTSELLTQARQPATAEAGRATELYDSTGGTLLYTLQTTSAAETQNWVDVDTLPPYVLNATFASEDINFLTNTRFDAADMVLKLWQNWLIETQPPDPSITGRLVRNVIAPAADLQGVRDLNTTRAREIALVAELERRYTPREILEWHLNTNYYGNEAYGIEAAAQLYLDKRAVDLSLDEAALLAAIPTAPQYNPFSSDIAARGRQGDVLRAMFNTGMIDEATYETSSARVTPVVRGNYLPPVAPEFTVYARRQAAAILDSLGYDGTRLVGLGGLRITTTLDLDLYQQISCVLDVYLARQSGSSAASVENCPAAAFLSRSNLASGGLPPDTGALVVLDAQTGTIQAIAGGATSVEHAPGVMLQPYVYLDSFLNGSQTPASMVFDIPNQFPGAQQGLIYTFANPEQPFRGPMNLRDAMGSWRLPPAAEIAYRQGMPDILGTAHQLGINSLDEARFDMMLLERGGAISLLDVAYSMSVFSTMGDMRGVPLPPVARGFRGRDPVAIARIEDQSGNVLWEYNEGQARSCATLDVCTPLLVPGAAYLVNDILSDQETRWSVYGQDSPFDTSIPAAVVAGVAGDGERHWTVGYSPNYVVGTVLYRADGQPTELDPDTVTTAAPVWHALIEYVHARSGVPVLPWERPDSVVESAVCETSGLLPNGVCPVINEVFLDGTQPQEIDTRWQVVEINNQNGRLANFNTAPELRSEARFFVPPEGPAMDWWVANGQPLPPVEFDDVSRAQVFETIHIARPQAFDYVGGIVDVYADINPRGIQYIQLEYGQGFNPTQWLSIGGQLTEFDVSQPIGSWDTRSIDGPYSLRLIAVMDDNTRESDALQVTVDNVTPTVTIHSVEPNKIYRWPTDEVVSLQAEAQDNLKIDRVEFYYEDDLLGADVSWPYSVDWQITGLGSHTFTAIAFDGVGNQVSNQVTVEILRAGA